MTTPQPSYGPLEGDFQGYGGNAGTGPNPDAGILDNAQATDTPTVDRHIVEGPSSW
jgi:hypothetical protein